MKQFSPGNLILNADLHAPEHLGIRNILTCAGKIVYVGEEQPDLPSSLNFEIKDMGGRKVIPGMIDPHVHITGGGGEGGPETMVPPVPLSSFTSAGVTTVVGVLGTDDVTRTTDSLLARTRVLRDQGLSAYCLTGGYHIPPTTLTGDLKKDIIHIDPIIGLGELAISDHRSSVPDFEKFSHIASEVYTAGMLSGKAGILNVHTGEGDDGLKLIEKTLEQTEIPAKTFYPTHVNRTEDLFKQALELSKQGCCIDITASKEEYNEDSSLLKALKLYFREDYPVSRLTLSSDAGGSLPAFNEKGELTDMDYAKSQSLANVLRCLFESELNPDTFLPAFCSNIAELFKLSSKGRIHPDMDADIVVLNDDFRVSDVMVEGQWHVVGEEQIVGGAFE